MYFSSPLAQKGRELLHSTEHRTGERKGCHLNTRENSSSSLQNGNRNTGVDNMLDNPLKLVWKKTIRWWFWRQKTRKLISQVMEYKKQVNDLLLMEAPETEQE